MSQEAVLGQSGEEESASFSRKEVSDSMRSHAKSRLSAGSVADCGMTVRAIYVHGDQRSTSDGAAF